MSDTGVDLEAEIDALYAGELGAFVPAREVLARRLRAEKRRDDANRVKKLARPTIAAWALDRAARAHPDLVDALAAAGATLRDAQAAAIGSGGGGGGGLREALSVRRAAVRSLIDAAAAVLTEVGSDPSAHRDGLAAALETIALDDDLLATLRRGTLAALPTAVTGLDQLLALTPETIGTPTERQPRPSRPTRRTDRSTGQTAEAEPPATAMPSVETDAGTADVDLDVAADEAAAAAAAAREEARRAAEREAARGALAAAQAQLDARQAHLDGLHAEAAELARRIAEAERAVEVATGVADAARRRMDDQ